MIMNEEIKAVVKGSAFLSLVTMNADGTPHLIVAGKGEVDGENIVFNVHRMNTTQKNLKADKNAWVIAATRDGGSKGYRLIGTAEVKDKQLIFAPAKAEALL